MIHNHGDGKSPKDRVVGHLPNGLFMAYKRGLLLLTTYKSWDDPPNLPLAPLSLVIVYKVGIRTLPKARQYFAASDPASDILLVVQKPGKHQLRWAWSGFYVFAF